MSSSCSTLHGFDEVAYSLPMSGHVDKGQPKTYFDKAPACLLFRAVCTSVYTPERDRDLGHAAQDGSIGSSSTSS